MGLAECLMLDSLSQPSYQTSLAIVENAHKERNIHSHHRSLQWLEIGQTSRPVSSMRDLTTRFLRIAERRAESKPRLQLKTR